MARWPQRPRSAASGLAASTAAGASTAPTGCRASPADTAAEGNGRPRAPRAGGSLPGEGIDISFIQGVIGDGFYISMECGVQDAADAARRRLVNVQGPDAFDATLQNPIIDAVVASEPDAILVAPNDVEASAGPLQRAQDAGIQVILVDTAVNDESIGVSRIASDNFQGGVTAADALAELIGETGHGDGHQRQPGHLHDRPRQAGFEEQIATYPDIEYIGTEFSNNDPAKAAEIVTAAIAANPDLNGVFAANLFSAQGTATGRPGRAKPTCRSSASTPGRPRSTSSRPVTSRRSSSRSPTTSATRASSRRSPPSTATR